MPSSICSKIQPVFLRPPSPPHILSLFLLSVSFCRLCPPPAPPPTDRQTDNHTCRHFKHDPFLKGSLGERFRGSLNKSSHQQRSSFYLPRPGLCALLSARLNNFIPCSLPLSVHPNLTSSLFALFLPFSLSARFRSFTPLFIHVECL